MVQTIFWIVCSILIISLVIEFLPSNITEGFASADSRFWSKLVPRRGDIGPEQEQDGLIRDGRYFSGYVDVQRFGVKTDFCRVVNKAGASDKDKFLACGLGGTENLSSTAFRSPSVRDGFVLGRDDYMRDVDGDSRDDYCRIVKKEGGTFEATCSMALENGFDPKMTPDNNPPEEIARLLNFYNGIVFWLRLRDDMVDYAQNLYINSSGRAAVVESPPRPDKTEGLSLNGDNQFLRIGDDPYLAFGSVVQLRTVRAFHFWVRFEEFTNNAHIFDFGNGAGIDNVWVGILNRGNLGADQSSRKKSALLCGGDTTVPSPPSGAQPGVDVTPQELMLTTDANVEEFTCEGFAVAPRNMPRTIPKATAAGADAKTADMCYEIWDRDQRKMRIVVPSAFVLGEWTHVVITAEGTDSFRPDIVVYINGRKKFAEPSGWLPQTNITEKNYIGKSNWANATSQYANKDELLRGDIFDFRAYNVGLNEKTVFDSYLWGRKLLQL